MNVNQGPQREMEVGVDYVIIDPGTGKPIPLTKNAGCVELVLAAVGETNTLPSPSKPGIELTIYAKTVAASATRIISTSSNTRNGTTAVATITFDANTDYIMLRSIYYAGSLAWAVTTNTAALA